MSARTRRLAWLTTIAAATVTLGVMFGCMEPLEAELPDTSEMAVGESRVVELRYLRFDVTNFEQVMTKDDLLALPQDIQNRLWLLDMDLSNSPSSPHLMDNALLQIRTLDPDSLELPARNMQALLNMTPDTAELSGTSFEQMLELGPLLGVPAERVLADLVGINVEDTFLSTEAVTQTMLAQVIGSHPNAQMRLGPRTADNPEGLYPVAPESLPITLADAASDFATLGERFGPVFVDGVYHPGFIDGEARSQVLGDDFAMTVRANANALPYKGIDLGTASVASVNSVASQIDTLFNFDDPDWLVIEGLTAGVPTIEEMTFRIVEADGFIEGGRSPNPAPYGSSEGWRLPAWSLERVVLGASLQAFGGANAMIEYYLPSSEDPAMLLEVTDGWIEIETTGGLGSPPPPAYIWDLLLEVAQIRLHDGGIAEGEADVSFTLRDVPVGIDTDAISDTIRQNLQDDPTALVDVASLLIDTTVGEADFYYYRPDDSNAESIQGDYLYFIIEADIGLDDNGDRVREYAYPNPGFFADAALTQRISETTEIDGDDLHDKVRVEPGDVLYVQDHDGAVFRIDVLDKPSRNRIALELTRAQ